MSRELKFRIWDKKESEYMCLGATGIDALTGEVVDYYWDATSLKKEDYIIEQYTGLKDKNDNEIYEGDILQIDDHILGDFEVVWHNLSWKIKCSVGYETLSVHKTEDIVVIGNIHENPELLKEER